MAETFAEVALNLAVDRTFTYRVPEPLRAVVVPGRRVRVPFRRRTVAGYCVALSDRTGLDRVLDVAGVLDEGPLVSGPLLELTRRMAEYYCCSWGQALAAAVPLGVRRGTESRTETVVHPAVEADELKTAVEELERRSPKQAQALETLGSLEEEVTLPELARMAGCSRAPINGLRRKGLVHYAQRKVTDDPLLSLRAERQAPLELEPAQRAALRRVLQLRRGDRPGVALLHGVTGSGKTEIYLQAIDRVVAEGEGAVVLVPEISLTPQTVRRFKARFDHVSVLHSHLTESQRREQWEAIRSGRTEVVVGARSAIFAPMPRLGLIVVDEEHETSFKQDKVPRYHARDVAVLRGRLENAVVVLGSATPSLESYQNARAGKYQMSHLPGRVQGRPLPRVELVDMTKEMAAVRRFRFLSRRLVYLIEDRLSRGEQVIVFLNRRGFATYVFCGRCGWAMKCRHCDISMTYHKRLGRAVCHHCGLRMPLPEVCPDCKAPTVQSRGLGTEKVEDEVRARFPGVVCERMDSDTVRGRGSHQRVLDAFRAGRTKILVGTQMIAKGLDFPNVTLVGVVNADTALHLPDFRAGERTHQLVSQVAGRTGRGPKGGLVVVQTSQPEHIIMQSAAAHDYVAFAEIELGHRRALHLPPFGRAARIIVDGRGEAEVRETAGRIGTALGCCAEELGAQVHGPQPCPIERIKDRFRWHLLLLAGKWSALRDMIGAARPVVPSHRRVRVVIDVDPVSML
jgi:primosomal protein N' (replication factor Y)